jgi:hypothetical protein
VNSDIQGKENQIIKTLLLIVSLFRRGPNTIMNFQWSDALRTIEAISSKNSLIIELSNFCRQKITIYNTVKSVFRGNFYIDELSKFKSLNIDMINALYTHLAWVVDSINSKFLFLKEEKAIMDYVREIYCD